ncbi:MAG: ABC transporter permease [Acidimicrobiales bacterium]
MNGRALTLAWYRFRATLRVRRAGYLAVVLLVALVGGVAMGALAGARRTESAFPRYLASTHATAFQADIWNLGESLNGPATTSIARRLGHLAGVVRVTSAPSLLMVPVNKDGQAPPSDAAIYGSEVNIVGSVAGMYFRSDRVSVISGRLADPRSTREMDATAAAASILGWHVGETIRFADITPAEAESGTFVPSAADAKSVVSVKLVGLVVFATQVAHDEVDRYPSDVLMTPALTRELRSSTTLPLYGFVLKNGARSVTAVQNEIIKVLPKSTVYAFHDTSTVLGQVQRASRPVAIALGVFGLIAALAVLLIGGLTIARRLWADSADVDILRALGADSVSATAEATLGLLGAVVLGALLAAAVALLISPLTLLGPIRDVEPSPGFSADWTVLGTGVAVIVLALGLLTIVLAFRRARRSGSRGQEPVVRDSAVVTAASRAGLALPALVGVRFALQRGRGRTSVPVRSVLVGSVLAVLVVTATVTFANSLRVLNASPALYGWNWNYAIDTGAGGSVPPITSTLLGRDRDVAAWTGFDFGDVQIDGQTVPELDGPAHAPFGPPLLAGHALDGPHQVVVGAATLAALHKKLGDTVYISYGTKQNAPIYVAPTALKIVGVATFPAIGTPGTLHPSMGTGILFDTAFEPPAFAKAIRSPDKNLDGPAIVVVRLRNDVSAAAGLASLRRVTAQTNKALQADPNSEGDATSVVGVQRPAEIVAYQATGAAPSLLALALVAGAVAALGLALASSVRRRRRELALLKAFGFTHRQLATAVSCQASLCALVGAVLGVPLGILLGRWLWTLFAREIYAVPEPSVPVVSMFVIVLGALVLANLVAAIPGRIAARTSTALVLRAE